MFDHEKERGIPFCPLMKEPCVAGWTKSMGQTETGERPKCAAWRALPLVDVPTQQMRTVHACSIFEWPPFLGYELSGNVAKAVSSTDKVANEVRGLKDKPIMIDVAGLIENSRPHFDPALPPPETRNGD
jgi:hypothetical protein